MDTLVLIDRTMPTNKQRLTLTIPPELYEALEECATRENRTLANQAAIALDEFLRKTGDLKVPVKLGSQGRPRKTRKKQTDDQETIGTDI